MAAVAATVCAVALVAVVLLATSAGGSSGSYEVRAIFDDAGNLTSGENVKIDGVNVGTVGSVTPTPQAKAAVVLKITTPGFQDFREDASCTVRPQALIGEKFVDCLPTQPRVEGTPLPPPLKTIPAGQEGAGQVLLPVTNTHSPVDPDLLGDITRLPEAQRLTILLNEFGAGLAGRGSDLNVVIRRANPALQQLEAVFAILAKENKVLTDLAVEGDRALAPIAADRGQVVGFIKASKTVAQATANQRGALAQNLADFPAFLEQLGPAMERLGRFAEQTTPTLEDLGIAAPGINKLFKSTAPFSKSFEGFLSAVGKNAKKTASALKAVEPLLGLAKGLGKNAKPFASNFSGLLTNLKSTGGLERLLDFIYLGAGSVNGYDALGHFLRAEIVASAGCIGYAIVTNPSCSTGKFIGGKTAGTTATAAGSSSTSLVMQRTLAVLKGMTPAEATAKYPGSVTAGATGAGALSTASGAAPTAQPVGGAASGTTYYSPSSESSEASGMLLNYLLGD
ncbi:MAG TPA: MlaD family protein [Solirubrobacteraceae bacterium]|jgi:phospholipid/cholesterol/gamma-HCH transport system substrate-binding protein|nr:MlaD family protein [Solirubrobacteraceae bacterium]